jgi:hypothetical protein
MVGLGAVVPNAEPQSKRHQYGVRSRFALVEQLPLQADLSRGVTVLEQPMPISISTLTIERNR